MTHEEFIGLGPSGTLHISRSSEFSSFFRCYFPFLVYQSNSITVNGPISGIANACKRILEQRLTYEGAWTMCPVFTMQTMSGRWHSFFAESGGHIVTVGACRSHGRIKLRMIARRRNATRRLLWRQWQRSSRPNSAVCRYQYYRCYYCCSCQVNHCLPNVVA